jgi:hypothetical protein
MKYLLTQRTPLVYAKKAPYSRLFVCTSHLPATYKYTTSILSLLHQQQMHGRIRKHDESTAVDTQPDAISPKRLYVKAKAAQDSRARDFDVQAVLVVDEREVLNLIHDETLEGVVEYGQLST